MTPASGPERGPGPGCGQGPRDEPAFEPAWLPPPADLTLDPDQVHVWRAALDFPGAAHEMAHLLSDDERERAGRILLDGARERFVAGRFLLRTVLGKYLGLPAGQVELTYGPHGKPEVAPGCSSGRVMFSLAHSRDLVLIAVTGGRAVGVDVEFVRPLSDVDGLVARVFSAAEQAEWLALAPGMRLQGFFRGWTAKEAWLKAKSTGLTWPPNWFSVSLTPGTPLRLVEVAGDPDAPQRWSLASFEAAPGCLGALALEGLGRQAGFFDLPLSLLPGLLR